MTRLENVTKQFPELISIIKKIIFLKFGRESVVFEHGMCACIGGLDRAHLHIMTIHEKTNNRYPTCRAQALVRPPGPLTLLSGDSHCPRVLGRMDSRR